MKLEFYSWAPEISRGQPFSVALANQLQEEYYPRILSNALKTRNKFNTQINPTFQPYYRVMMIDVSFTCVRATPSEKTGRA